MNSDMLLNRIRMAQQGLIGVHKKLYTLEHLLPSPDPAQFAETAKSAALLSERSTASLRGFLFTTTGGMPEGYYQQAAAAQGIKVSATDDYVFVTCDAYVTADRRTKQPLGTLANGELRHKRILAHHALHNVQTSLGMNRDQSYRWLQTQMRLPGDQVHIAKCGDYLCEQIIRICENATTSHK